MNKRIFNNTPAQNENRLLGVRQIRYSDANPIMWQHHVSFHYLTSLLLHVWKGKDWKFNDALNTFYLWLYHVRHMAEDHSDSEKENSFRLATLICSIKQTKNSFLIVCMNLALVPMAIVVVIKTRYYILTRSGECIVVTGYTGKIPHFQQI